jgi:hypothetical protein
MLGYGLVGTIVVVLLIVFLCGLFEPETLGACETRPYSLIVRPD